MRRILGLFMLAGSLTLIGCFGQQKVSPAESQRLTQEGHQLVNEGRHAEANKALEQAAKSEAADARTFVLLGITRYQQKDLDGAIKAYDRAIQLNPNLPEPYQGKANIFRDRKNLTEAQVWYRKAWAVDPKFVDAYSELALQLQLANRTNDAVAVLQEGIRNVGQITDLHLLLARIQIQLGQKEQAKRLLEEFLSIYPNHPDAVTALNQIK